MMYGYARVSKVEQNLDRQVEMLRQHGVDMMFTEKMTGTLASRPELEELLRRVKRGDTVVVESFSRFARSTKNLLELVDTLTDKGVNLVSLKENFDTTTAQGKMMLSVVAAFAQFERDLIVERTREGLAVARARGKKGGRKHTEVAKLERAKTLYDMRKFTAQEIANMTGISRNVLYRYMRNPTPYIKAEGEKRK